MFFFLGLIVFFNMSGSGSSLHPVGDPKDSVGVTLGFFFGGGGRLYIIVAREEIKYEGIGKT